MEVRDAATMQLLHNLDHGLNIDSVARSPDSTVLSYCPRDGSVRFWAVEKGQPSGARLQLTAQRHLVVAPEGLFTGSPQIERQLVVVVITEDGRQETLTPAGFEQKYRWKNEPDKARLLPK